MARKQKYESAAHQWRRYLEPQWPLWRNRLESIFPDMMDHNGPASKGMCDLSAVWLRGIIGGEIKVGLIILPTEKAWAHHCWLEHGGFIIDLTADQFGLPSVVVSEKSEAIAANYSESEPEPEFALALEFNRNFLRLT